MEYVIIIAGVVIYLVYKLNTEEKKIKSKAVDKQVKNQKEYRFTKNEYPVGNKNIPENAIFAESKRKMLNAYLSPYCLQIEYTKENGEKELMEMLVMLTIRANNTANFFHFANECTLVTNADDTFTKDDVTEVASVFKLESARINSMKMIPLKVK